MADDDKKGSRNEDPEDDQPRGPPSTTNNRTNDQGTNATFGIGASTSTQQEPASTVEFSSAPGELQDFQGGIPLPDARPVWYNFETIKEYAHTIKLWKQIFKWLLPHGDLPKLYDRDDFKRLRFECGLLMFNHQRTYCQEPWRDAPCQQLLLQPTTLHQDATIQLIEFELPSTPEIRYVSLNSGLTYVFNDRATRWDEPMTGDHADGRRIAFDPYAVEHAVAERFADKYTEPPPPAHPSIGSQAHQQSGHHEKCAFYYNQRIGGELLRMPQADGSNDDGQLPQVLYDRRLQAIAELQSRQQQQQTPKPPSASTQSTVQLPSNQSVGPSNQPNASASTVATGGSTFEDQMRFAFNHQQRQIGEQREAIAQMEQQFKQHIAAITQHVNQQISTVNKEVAIIGQSMQANQEELKEMLMNRNPPTGYTTTSTPNIAAAVQQEAQPPSAYHHQSMANLQQPTVTFRPQAPLPSINEDREQHYHVPQEIQQRRHMANMDAPPPGPLHRTPSALDILLTKGKVPNIGLEKFDGTSKTMSMTQWFKLYEHRMRAMCADTTDTQLVKALAFYLAGQAAIWATDHLAATPNQPPTWRETKLAMIKRFQITDTGYLFTQFQRTKPEPNEDLRTYGNRLLQLLSQALPSMSIVDRDQMLAETFQANLPAAVADKVNMFMDATTRSFDDITTYASKVQLKLQQSSTTPKPTAIAAYASGTDQSTSALPILIKWTPTGIVQVDASTVAHSYLAQQQPFSIPPAPVRSSQQQPNYQSPGNNTNRGDQSNSQLPTSPANRSISYSPFTKYQYDTAVQAVVPHDVQSRQCHECSAWGHVRAHCPSRSACQECGRTPGHGQLRCPNLYARDVEQVRQSLDQENRRLGQNPSAAPYVPQQPAASQQPPTSNRQQPANLIVQRVQCDNQFPIDIYKSMFKQLLSTPVKKTVCSPSGKGKDTKLGLVTNKGYDSGFEQESASEQDDAKSISSIDSRSDPCSISGKVVTSQSGNHPGRVCGRVVGSQSSVNRQRDLPLPNNVIESRQDRRPKSTKKKRRKKKSRQQPSHQQPTTKEALSRPQQANRFDQFLRILQRCLATCGYRIESDVDTNDSDPSGDDSDTQF